MIRRPPKPSVDCGVTALTPGEGQGICVAGWETEDRAKLVAVGPNIYA